MRKISSYFSHFLLVILAASTILPVGVGAATKTVATPAKKTVVPAKYALDLYNPRRRYGDEKVDIKNAASRCNTPALYKIHLKNLERAKQDGKVYELTLESVSTTEPLTPIGEAYKKYLAGLDLAWGAMEEPYCGFGAFGTQAANKSYNKSVERARSRFLEAAKAQKAALAKTKHSSS